jgi:microcystin-dependent protein
MPRNNQGVYALPAGNPVVPGTLIETTWANPTMSDIAAALTGSLPRDGSAGMTGPLILSNSNPTNPLEAASKAYVQSFMVYATGMPVGAAMPFLGNTPPPGFLVCDGQAVSRTTYAELFAVIGTIYGAGDGVLTFNVPDLRNQFIRGKADDRAVGSLQAGSFAAHTHPVSDPGHTHANTVSGSQAAHSHGITTGSHSHGVSDPGHRHNAIVGQNVSASGIAGGSGVLIANQTEAALTGIGIQTAGNLGGNTDAQQPVVTVNIANASSTTNETIGSTGGAETVPQNMALIYVVKAVNDTTQVGAVTSLSSSDSNMIAIDSTNPAIPELDIKSNVAFGIPKLDAGGKILLAQLPQGSSVLLGYFNASSGANPSQAFPATNYSNGESYIISVGGTILVRDPATSIESNTLVAVGGMLLYLEGQTQPDGWYYSIPVAASSASNISFLPEGTIAATNVQAAIAELDSETQGQIAVLSGEIGALQTGKQDAATAVTKDTATGGAFIPAGTTAERPATPSYGQQRANSTLNSQEWWNGTAWVPMGGGATGGAGNGFVYENDIHVTQNYTLTANKNGMSAGPIIVDDGVSVTVPSGSVWSIV